MTEKIESQGKTVEAAVSEALLQMGARRDEVEIKILEEPKSGFLGLLGGRQARVLVRRKPMQRGGRSRDYREDKDGYKAHNLSGGKGSPRRRGGGRSQGKDTGRQDNRTEKSGGGSQRGGRGGQGRPQEARAQKPAQGGDQTQERGARQDQPARAEGEGRRSRGRRGGRNRRGGESRPEARQDARTSARPDGGSDTRADNRQEKPSDNRPDNRSRRQEARPEARPEPRQGRNQRQERRPAARQDNQAPAQTRAQAEPVAETRPAAAPVEKAAEKTTKPRSHRPGGLGSRARRGQKTPPREPVVAKAEEIVADTPVVETPVIETPVVETPVVETPVVETPVVETPVQTPEVEAAPVEPAAETKAEAPAGPKPRRGFGGLGARLREKKKAERAAVKQAETGNAPAEPASTAPPARPAPRTSYSDGPGRDRGRRSSRPPMGSSARDEMILEGITATKYATPVRGVPESEWEKTLTEMTDGMLARAGFPCGVETHPGEYRQVRITTDDESAGMLIGRHGQAIDAIEHLVDRMVSNAAGDRVRMNLDINEYRLRREESLVEKVVEAAARIREDGRSIHMEPMSARERRVVHLEAEKIADLRTFTMIGSGGKHVVIAAEEKQADDQGGNAADGDDFHEHDET